MERNITFIIISLMLFFLVSCSHMDSEFLAENKIHLPGAYSIGASKPIANHRWWKSFPFKGLDAFIAKSLKSNLSLKEAKYLFEQVKMNANKSAASLYPSLSTSFQAKTNKNETNGESSQYENYNLGLAASYEIDFWRKLNSAKKASDFDVLANRYNYQIITHSIASLIVENWIKIIAERLLQKKLKEIQLINQDLKEHSQAKYLKGQSGLTDYLVKQQNLLGVMADLPLSKNRENFYYNELLLLQGIKFENRIEIKEDSFDNFPDFPEVGLPVNLIAQRPDIKMAQAELEAELARYKSAKATRFPALSLDASYVFQSASISDLLDNWLSSLAANIAYSIFDGGVKKANVLMAKSKVQQKIVAYQKTVLTAFKEVDVAILNEKHLSQNIQLLSEKAKITDFQLVSMLDRYKNGNVSYSEVIQILKTFLNQELILIQKKMDRWMARISLYRSLGGDWINNLVEDELKIKNNMVGNKNG